MARGAGDGSPVDGALDAMVTADVADATPALDASIALDASVASDARATVDAPREVATRDAGPRVIPRTFQDDCLPEFRVEIASADLTAMRAAGNDRTYPMVLSYMGARQPGTIRHRLGNNSSCGDKRQFRFDFPSHVTLRDGYRTDRFVTDRGSCYVLHEWLAESIARRAAARRPELNMAYKLTNVVAVYFNDTLYHVQTLTEDANRDLMERFEGTRNLTL